MEDKSKQHVMVKIETADNEGVVCRVCYNDMEQEKTYVYKTIQEAAKALPAIFTVAEAEAPDETEKSLHMMKEKLTGKEY